MGKTVVTFRSANAQGARACDHTITVCVLLVMLWRRGRLARLVPSTLRRAEQNNVSSLHSTIQAVQSYVLADGYNIANIKKGMPNG